MFWPSSLLCVVGMIAGGKFLINGAAPFILSLFQDYGYVTGQNFPRLERGPTFSSDIHVNKHFKYFKFKWGYCACTIVILVFVWSNVFFFILFCNLCRTIFRQIASIIYFPVVSLNNSELSWLQLKLFLFLSFCLSTIW